MTASTKAKRVFLPGLVCVTLLSGCPGDAYVQATGFVHDPAGAPIPGATVTLKPAPESDCREEPAENTTNAAGEFSTLLMFSPATRRREFLLRVEKPGFLPHEERISEDAFNVLVTLEPAA
jgi:hypothetical protein